MTVTKQNVNLACKLVKHAQITYNVLRAKEVKARTRQGQAATAPALKNTTIISQTKLNASNVLFNVYYALI